MAPPVPEAVQSRVAPGEEGVTREVTILRDIMRTLGTGAVRLWRNNVGVAMYPDGSRVVYGLCPGSSDLIGYRTVEVTPAMVGQRVAVFVAVEVKAPGGRLTAEQAHFLATVTAAGGIGVEARSAEQAAALVLGDLPAGGDDLTPQKVVV